MPASASTALNSPLMGLLEKNRFEHFVQFVVHWDEANPATLNGYDPNRHAMIQVYQKFGLAEATIDFIGHAVALHTSDAYLRQPCFLTSNKSKLYAVRQLPSHLPDLRSGRLAGGLLAPGGHPQRHLHASQRH